MRVAGLYFFFLSFGLLMAVAVAEMFQLSIGVSAVISVLCTILLFLMLDLRPDPKVGEATITRLTRGSWYRKRK